MEKGQQLRVEITSLSSEGDGVGHHEGMALFVEGVLPGESAEVVVTEVKKRYAKGRTVQRVEDSPNRVTPSCPSFGRCGGCSVMHLSYEKQLEAKRQRVADAVQRLGGFKDVEVLPCLASPNHLAYRNKVEFSYAPKNRVLGLKEKKSHRVIDIERCFIHSDAGDKVYREVRRHIDAMNVDLSAVTKVRVRSSFTTNEVMVAFMTNRESRRLLQPLADALYREVHEVQSVVEVVERKDVVHCLAGKLSISESFDGLLFSVSATSFFQVNTLQAEVLYRTALALADIDETKSVLDAYCGVGTLSLLAARHAKSVVGIESHPQAVEDAKENAKNNGITNCTFQCGLTEHLIGDYSDVDVVLLNPPRGGCEKSVIDALIEAKPAVVVYVSCDPSTLARDLKLLCEGGFAIDAVQPVDMFPQTMHVETVVRIRCL